MGTGVKALRSPQASPPSTALPSQAAAASANARTLPTTGMRGGLGRTLLTAFLALTIMPFALIGWYVVVQNRSNLQVEATSKLQLMATLKAENLESWLLDRADLFRAVVEAIPEAAALAEDADEGALWVAVQGKIPELHGVVWLRGRSQQVWGECALPAPQATLPCEQPLAETRAASVSAAAPSSVPIVFPGVADAETLVLCFDPVVLMQNLQHDLMMGNTGPNVYLVRDGRVWLTADSQSTSSVLPKGACMTLADQSPSSAWYSNATSTPVVGAYFPLSELDVGILVEQEQREVLASTELIAATLIGGLLSVALLTTVISAFVIRQITRPVIRLTESALEMAEGNMEQHVPVVSRDEIGILTYVFNQMAGELKSLYEDLEAKVVARTQLLQKANYQIQRRAIQLEASLEVSQAVTSIRDPEALLERVAERIRERFSYVAVAVYLVNPGGAEARLHAASPEAASWPQVAVTGDGTVVGKALRKGNSQVINELLDEEVPEWYRRILSHVGIPMRMEQQALGVLAVRSAEHEGLQVDDVKVLEHLANQVAIALVNARAYERERQAAQQFEDNEAFKARFLANMSQELRGPLNSILGFSRLMLKGFDGPLSEEQAADVQRIHGNSEHLLDLINDILAISEIQAGLLDLKSQVVNLRDVITSVLPTASALVRGKDVQLTQDIAQDLASVQGDPDRIRQVLINLLTNAAKFTERGEIAIRAWSDDEMAYVSVRDTGVGIDPKDRERILAGFEKVCPPERLPFREWESCVDGSVEAAPSDGAPSGVGVGLALCKEFVELHGGQLWLDSDLGKGSTFTFSIPIASTKEG
ncbi:MAG: GAF domain-containing protein [Anaerolineae bacterium]|nr:GAF domain-containing protein [Anaerolineae bacterium]